MLRSKFLDAKKHPCRASSQFVQATLLHHRLEKAVRRNNSTLLCPHYPSTHQRHLNPCPKKCFDDTIPTSNHETKNTMLSTGFTDAPVTRSLVYGIVAASILASVTDTKHYFYIQVDPHLWRYHQIWRILTYQLCYTNSTEVLFAGMTVYNMRVIERLWGSRKYAVSPLPLIFVQLLMHVVVCAAKLCLHYALTTHTSRPSPAPPLLQYLQLSPRRPYATHLRHPSTIPRRHTTRV